MESLASLVAKPTAAVLVVDVQNDYCHEDGALGAIGSDLSGIPAMLDGLSRLLAAARAAGKRVIFVKTVHEDATDSESWKNRSSGSLTAVCRPGTWGAEFFGVSPAPEEIVVTKHRYSAFINTRLDTVLRAKKIETVIVAGVSTNVCVESTARDACMLDYNVVLASDACAAYSERAHDMTVENIGMYFGRVASVGEITAAWNAAEAGASKGA